MKSTQIPLYCVFIRKCILFQCSTNTVFKYALEDLATIQRDYVLVRRADVPDLSEENFIMANTTDGQERIDKLLTVVRGAIA